MPDKLFIPVIVGTTRQQRLSIHAAQVVSEIGNTIRGLHTQLIDPQDFFFQGDGNDPEGKDPRYSKIIAQADGLFIVTPEYNHSFPGSLKRMLDSELDLYIHKPVAFAGVSNGNWGGVRAIEQLVTATREMGLIASFTDVHFPRIQDMFDESGSLLDNRQHERIVNAWTELIWLAQTLKYGRSQLPSKYHA